MGNDVFGDLGSARWWAGQVVVIVLSAIAGVLATFWITRKSERWNTERMHDDQWMRTLLERPALVSVQSEMLAHQRWSLTVRGFFVLVALTVLVQAAFNPTAFTISLALLALWPCWSFVRTLMDYNRLARISNIVINTLIDRALAEQVKAQRDALPESGRTPER